MIMNIIKKTIFWLNCARVYSLPITVLNWIVIFTYAIKHSGSKLLGLIALVGISLVHMATNLIDDYFDYKILIKDEDFIKSAQNCKCAYLKTGQATVKELRNTILIFLFIAAVIGGILFFTSGYFVALLALVGLLIALTYQKFSLNGLGEVLVIMAYGPLLYEGTYYVMTSKFSIEVLLLSLACAFFTNTILYAHMLMDFDGDECSHKQTLCRLLKTKSKALNFILVFYICGFAFMGYMSYLTRNYYYLLTLLTIPLIFDLYKNLKNYNKDKNDLPEIKIWHYPLDNWEKIKTTADAPFYFRFFYSRNIVTFFMILTCIAILLA